eukprot:297965_1
MDLQGWLKGRPFDSIAPMLDTAVSHMKAKGVAKFGQIGFCWGSWVIFHDAARRGGASCGVSVHPSTKLETWAFERSQEELAAKVKSPQLLFPCKDDPDNVQPGGSVIAALASAKVLPVA